MRLLILSILTLSLYAQDSVDFLDDVSPVQRNVVVVSVTLRSVNSGLGPRNDINLSITDPRFFVEHGTKHEVITWGKILGLEENAVPYPMIIRYTVDGESRSIRVNHRDPINLR
jgi:hypothetical protein